MLSAASTSATIDGDDDSDVISQPAPTSCIQVPTLETIVAIHRLRKSALRNGLQGDLAPRAVAGEGVAGGAVIFGSSRRTSAAANGAVPFDPAVQTGFCTLRYAASGMRDEEFSYRIFGNRRAARQAR
jgi:hypothetical protein